jgi:aminoglycoside/choline kinase family phosphotransferase
VARPLLAEPAFDGMDLAPALTALWGSLPSDATLHKLKGDASTRSYYRLRSAAHSPSEVIIMRLPNEPGLIGGELPFLTMQRMLRELGLPVPEVLHADVPRGVVLLEDLGDVTFEARLQASPREEWTGLYRRAVELLAGLHERANTRRDSLAFTRTFDHKLLRWELEHFREWGLDALGLAVPPDARSQLDADFDRLVADILALPQGFAHRDYQSRNLMWPTPQRLVIIDFQDALVGPIVYDLVALLCDSYVELDEPLQRAMIAHMASLRGLPAPELERAFWLVAAQRKLKDAGRFVFLDQVRGNPDFLPWFAPSITYAGRALSHLPEYAGLGQLLVAAMPGFPDAVATPTARSRPAP